VNQKIVDLATRITADISMLEGVTVDLKSVPDGVRSMFRDGIKLSPTIELRIDGDVHLTLEFFEGTNLPDEFLEALDQFQDTIVESLLKAWPACAEHPHVLVPVSDGEDLKWQCPDNNNLEVLVGNLNHHRWA